MTTASTMLCSLFPLDWHARRDLLECAHRVDPRHGAAAADADVVLFAMTENRATGAVPSDADVRQPSRAELARIAGLRLDGAAIRLDPREHDEAQGDRPW